MADQMTNSRQISVREINARNLSEVLVPYIRHALGLPVSRLPDTSALVSAECLDFMMLHRLGGIVDHALSLNDLARPPELVRWFNEWRGLTMRQTGACLITARKILPAFEEAGIRVLIFKGPTLQQLAYGTPFHRPSSDLDLLVDIKNFDRSGEILQQDGYALAPICESLWWKMGLGERHFTSAVAASVTVDLHHRVQQPGCPLPRHPERFFENSQNLETGGRSVPTLSVVHSALLAAMSHAKALHHREPALRYLLDFMALVHGSCQLPWQSVVSEAELQGLRNTVGLTVRSIRLLFGADALEAAGASNILSSVSDDALKAMIISPNDPSIEWPRRRDLLFALVDDKVRYPGDFAAMVGSEMLRRAATNLQAEPVLSEASA